MNFLLTRILWLRRSKWQFLLAGLAFFIGLATLMLALDSFLRISSILNRQKEQGQFLILNKKISLVNTLGLESGSFEKAEIENIRKSGLFQDVGEVHSNKFRAQVISTAYINFQSMVFFESVPRSFLDNRPVDFRWSEGRKDLPIIVSQDFLNLYNFGFAMGQGFPQIGREALKLVSFDVVLDGPGGKEIFTGRVVGFTERIASVLVPEEFMRWSNRNIGGQKSESCSRVIVKVANASDPSIASFLKKFRLVTDFEKINLGKSGSTLELVMKGLTALGILFTLLALVMFSMNFRLVMAEAETDIRLLIELGYSHRKIARELLMWFSVLLLLIFAGAGFFLFSLDGLLKTAISAQGLEDAGSGFVLSSLFCGFLFTLLVLVWNSILIGNQLRKIA
jgi:hypothetical protein